MVRFAAHMLFLFIAGLLAALPAAANSPWAYRTIVIDGGPTGISSARHLDDIGQASIGYHHATAAAPQLWFGFDGKYGDKIHIQIGVPQLQQYRLLRPMVAIVGPGMPVPVDPLPFALPAGYGALIHDTAAQSVENYKEPLTGTESWRFSAEDFRLPASGPAYIVGFTPSGEEGKFWMAVGEKRSFNFFDLITVNWTILKVRAFFEVSATQGVVFWSEVLAGFLAVFVAIFALLPR